MALPTRPNPPPLGYPVPDVPHAVSVQLPKWQDMVDFAGGKERIRSVQQSGYPRSFLHPDVQKVSDSNGCMHKHEVMLNLTVASGSYILYLPARKPRVLVFVVSGGRGCRCL